MADIKLPPPIHKIGETPSDWTADLLAGNNHVPNSILISKNDGAMLLHMDRINVHRWDVSSRYIPEKKGWVLVVTRLDKGQPQKLDFGFYPRTSSTRNPKWWDGGLERWVSNVNRRAKTIRAKIPQPR